MIMHSVLNIDAPMGDVTARLKREARHVAGFFAV
jgi:hypothetical protein